MLDDAPDMGGPRTTDAAARYDAARRRVDADGNARDADDVAEDHVVSDPRQRRKSRASRRVRRPVVVGLLVASAIVIETRVRHEPGGAIGPTDGDGVGDDELGAGANRGPLIVRSRRIGKRERQDERRARDADVVSRLVKRTRGGRRVGVCTARSIAARTRGDDRC